MTNSLNPILPQNIGRYEVRKKVRRTDAVIPAGMFSSAQDETPTYLPPQWSTFVHPEGKIYFYRSSGLKTITESHLYTPEACSKVISWADEIEKRYQDRGFILSENVELYMQPDGDDCNYYLIDRDSHTIFWLEDHDTTELGLPPTVSSSHLKLALEVQYWSHIENFSMHFGGLPQKSIDDLILVFSHALADNLTSELSTFPYDANACEKYLNLLITSRDRIKHGNIVTIVARLWGVIIYSRYETHYGQQQARLSRDTAILEDEDKEVQWTKSAFSFISFRESDIYMKRLNTLFVDQFVYATDWKNFMYTSIKGWKQTGIDSFCLLLVHVFCFLLSVSPPLSYISGSLCGLSLITSVLLINRHEPLEEENASSAHDYLSAIRSPNIRFQGVAFVYALPKILFTYALILIALQGAVIIYHSIGATYAFLCLGVVCAFLASFQLATSPSKISLPRPFIPFSIAKYFRTKKDGALMV